jgi:hypothetical protein
LCLNNFVTYLSSVVSKQFCDLPFNFVQIQYASQKLTVPSPKNKVKVMVILHTGCA